MTTTPRALPREFASAAEDMYALHQFRRGELEGTTPFMPLGWKECRNRLTNLFELFTDLEEDHFLNNLVDRTIEFGIRDLHAYIEEYWPKEEPFTITAPIDFGMNWYAALCMLLGDFQEKHFSAFNHLQMHRHAETLKALADNVNVDNLHEAWQNHCTGMI
ncbi:hypothetical protein COT97_01340 [Candidatus Falkowbacteria bacterium CG10_big_fil_rev_8_21_14_0_10_39_11]|uniref:Uncharacterized protein n=1 Tax=Candidatus Falkowbacteria bacterium CG10_big_fil_rev_8_21_14_0_10_39_11 TaxID=1974565 RepID=A0A2H0V7P6_9BACT|nr:MAG: hypothetical protein COT97_01340 [Candidatus Falkowbacteria bacterium CG10_big_fil_rev_8_21_14_0_10_39_11]